MITPLLFYMCVCVCLSVCLSVFIYLFIYLFSGESLQKIHAVKVDFESPKGNGADSYYSDNPICRVFDFKTAKLTEYNIQNPVSAKEKDYFNKTAIRHN